MNSGLLAGLGALLGGVGGQMTKNYERRQEENAAERKARLALQLEEELWQRKMDYAKANPTYEKFMTDPLTGDVTAFDQFGRSKSVLTADPRVEANNLKMLDAEYNAKMAPYMNAKANEEENALLNPLRAAQLQASANASNAAAEKYRRPAASAVTKPLSPTQQVDMYNKAANVAMRMYPQYFSRETPWGEVIEGDPAMQEQAIQQILARATGGGLLSAPPAAAPASDAPTYDDLQEENDSMYTGIPDWMTQ